MTPPTGYNELLDVLRALRMLLREARRRRSLSMRTAATQMSLSASTLSRFEGGEDIELSTAITILTWVAQPDHEPSVA